MIISDYESANKDICNHFRLKGFKHIFPFFSPTEALTAVPVISPDLIVASMNMHGLDGWQISKILKSKEFQKHSKVPIILFSTTHKDVRAQQIALDSGVSAIFQVPAELDNLMNFACSLVTPGSDVVNHIEKNFKVKVVIANNDANILNSFKVNLENKGYQVETADDGEKAILVIEKMNPHIAILDSLIPLKDGMEVLKWIKDTIPEMGVIILADGSSGTAAVNFMKNGADDYLTKPFDMEQIIGKCEESFNKYNMRIIDKQFRDNVVKFKDYYEKYWTIADYSADFIYMLDVDGNFSFVNGGTETILGYKPDEMLGKPFFSFIFKEDIEKVHRKFCERRTGNRGGEHFEVRMICKQNNIESSEKGSLLVEARDRENSSEGAERRTSDMLVRCQGLYLEERFGKKVFRGTIGVAKDITSRKRIKEQLAQAEKLSTIGILVSGVAHELNNPLTGILGFSELILEDSSQPESIKNDIKKIHSEALRCSKIVRSLLTFARKYKIEKEWTSMNDVVQNTVELIEFQLASANIKLHLDLSMEDLVVFVDYHQIQQILINIISNAIHAIQDTNRKGNIFIQTRVSDSKWSTLSIKNDGPLIKKEVIGRIFETFFTTKGSEKGTGLGLSIARGIIMDHGGSINVENLPDGVIFIIELPLKSGSLPSANGSQNMKEKFIKGKKILIVEDGKIVRQLLKRFLDKDGHLTEAVTSGEEGLKVVKKEQFDLIISDIKLPEMNGIAFYKLIAKIRPELQKRFIFISGAIPQDVIKFSKNTGNRYLQKPFRQLEIRKLIKEIFKDSAEDQE